KDAHGNCTEPTTETVDGYRAARIVNLQYSLVEQHAATDDRSGDDADDDGGRSTHKCARGGNSDETSQHAVAGHRDVRVFVEGKRDERGRRCGRAPRSRDVVWQR